MKIGNFHIGFTKRSTITGDGSSWLAGYNPNGAPNVDSDSIMGLSAAWRCVRILSETLAGLPCGVKEYTSSGIDNVKQHQANDLLKGQANGYMSALSFKELMMYDALLRGNFYALIVRDSNARPVRLIPITESSVKILKYDNDIVYEVKAKEKTIQVLSENMFHLKGISSNGISGISVISAFKDGFGLSLSAQKYGKEFYDNGGNLDSYVSVPGKLTEPVKQSIRESINGNYYGLGKSKVGVFDNGVEFKQLGMRPEDAQYLGTREFQAIEVARIFGVPSHMINIGDRATYNNLEAYATEFVQYGLIPWIRRFEIETDTKLLRESEKGKRFFKVNVNGLLRGDSAARAAFYKAGLTDRWLTPNDVRKLEDLNPIEGGEMVAWPTNMIPTAYVEEWAQKLSNGETSNTAPPQD